jgi:hypothetical protein
MGVFEDPMRLWYFAASLLLMGTFPLDSAAVVAIECTAYASFDPAGGDPPQIVVDTTSDTCTASLSPETIALDADGAGALGFLLARAEYTRIGEIPIDDADTFAQTSFRDTIVVNAPELTGQTVTIHAVALLNGVIDVTGTGQTGVTLVASPGGQLIFETCSETSLCFGSVGNYPRVISEVVDFDINVEVGASSSLKLTLTASGGNGGAVTAPGSALSDFGGDGGLTWGGISEVTYQGEPIAYTITSESGTDWTQPVPEPGAVAGLGAAVALALLRTRASIRRRV